MQVRSLSWEDSLEEGTATHSNIPAWIIPETHMHAKLLQTRLTVRSPRDYSPPGSPVHGTLQARILQWVAMPSFRGSSQPRDRRASLRSPASLTSSGRQVLHHYHHLRRKPLKMCQFGSVQSLNRVRLFATP